MNKKERILTFWGLYVREEREEQDDGSVVTKDIPSHVIAAGVPCKVIRKITEEDIIYWRKELEEYRNEVGIKREQAPFKEL